MKCFTLPTLLMLGLCVHLLPGNEPVVQDTESPQPARVRRVGKFGPVESRHKVSDLTELRLTKKTSADQKTETQRIELVDVKSDTVLAQIHGGVREFAGSVSVSASGDRAVIIMSRVSAAMTWGADYACLVVLERQADKWNFRRVCEDTVMGMKDDAGKKWIENVIDCRRWPILECTFCLMDDSRVVRREGCLNIESLDFRPFGDGLCWSLLTAEKLNPTDGGFACILPEKRVIILSGREFADPHTTQPRSPYNTGGIRLQLSVNDKVIRAKVLSSDRFELALEHASQALSAVWPDHEVAFSR
jgi:hypothetical protein